MKKKLLAMLMSATLASAMIAGCGGSGSDTATEAESSTSTEESSEEASTEEASTEEASTEETETEETADEEVSEGNTVGAAAENAAAGSFSLLDVSEDMIDVGAYGTDDNGAEIVFTMFTGPDGESYVSLFDFADGAGDVICGTYEAESEVDEDGDEWTYFSVSDAYTGNTYQLGVCERPSTEEVAFFNEDGDVIEGQFLTASETIDYMGSAAALLMDDSTGETTDETADATEDDEVIQQIKDMMSYGFAGASEAGEEVYFAFNENGDEGILGIVENGEATFLMGTMDDADGVVTITDATTGDSLSFTYEETTDDEGEACLSLTVVSNDAFVLLYPVEVSDVIDTMAQY